MYQEYPVNLFDRYVLLWTNVKPFSNLLKIKKEIDVTNLAVISR